MADEPVGRPDRHDIRVVVLLKPDEYTWLKAEAKVTGDTQSSYMRRMLIERRQAVELSKLSPEERGCDTSNPAQNLTSPNGLFTTEQVLGLFEQLKKKYP